VDELATRVAALEERVAGLSRRLDPTPTPTPAPETPADDALWALGALKARIDDGAGAVLFTGAVNLPTGEHYEWQSGRTVADLLVEDWSDSAGVLSALAHPVRLLLLHRVLAGVRTAAELADQEELGTSGQLYHHLRQLVSAGWLRTPARGQYAVPGDRVVPLLVILAGTQR